jgi:hypothetical protein
MSRWYEIAVEGTLEAFERFLAGTGAGARLALPAPPIRGTEVHLEPESLGERVRDLVGARSHHLLFAPEETARALLAALAGAGDLELGKLAEIAGGRFTFRVEAYSAEQRADIRSTCLTPPPGVQLLDFRETTESDPAAKGPEFFTPVHHYVYRASGAFEGPPPGILEAYKRCREHDFVHPGPLALETQTVEPAALGG